MAQWVISEFTRPARSLVESFRGLPASILSDCMNRQMAMDANIRPLNEGRRLLGPALTVQSVDACNWGGHQALEMVQPGDVLVIAARGCLSAAVWGHLMSVAARLRGASGVVIDGCIRDVSENRAEGLPVFCRGTCPAGPHKGWPCNINVPVSCAGVPVIPGDIVVGDDDGVVVVPLAHADEVLREARQRQSVEEGWYQRLHQGESTVSILGLGRPVLPEGGRP